MTNPGIPGRNLGMARVYRAANPAWVLAVNSAILKAANTKPYINADDIYPLIPPGVTTHDNKALGPLMRKAAFDGIIRKASWVEKCMRPVRHAADLQMWQSLVYGGRVPVSIRKPRAPRKYRKKSGV
jgi:hypothetical protein